MTPEDYTHILPEQYTGKEIIAEDEKSLDTMDEALQVYKQACTRLLNVNEWKSLMGIASAEFCAMDINGNKTNKPVEKGNIMRVNIPGPGNGEGDGYDWVIVEDLKEIDEPTIKSLAFRVRPTSNPNSENEQIAHFYAEESTSNFIVALTGNTVKAIIVDRNTKPNNEASSVIDKIRNMPVAIGAIGLLSKVQWQNLAASLLKE